MVSQEPLACYPRRTFYPLIDNLSTQHYRITMTDFRLCLTRLSYSQANIYHCAKTNFYTPPLHFRRQPPQLNYQIYMVLSLVFEQIKSGISILC